MGQFFKQIFASVIGSLVGLVLFCVLGTSGLLFLIVYATMQETSPTVKEKTFLVFDLSMNIKDTKPPLTLNQALQEDTNTTMTLRQVLDTLEEATRDNRIIGIFLDGRGADATSGYATLTEVRGSLEKFRASGKKIYAYDVGLSEKDYYLASVADKIILNPMGMMEFNGLATQSLFMSEALKKYGIGVQVIRVGEYKAAVEPFIRQNLSTQNKEQTKALLDDIWQIFLKKVGKSRNLELNQLQFIADNQGVLTPSEAQKQGLVDQVAYLDQVVAEIRKTTGSTDEDGSSFRQISLPSYNQIALKDNLGKSSDNKIALVYAEGEIVDGEGNLRNIGGDSLAKELRKIGDDDNIKAVVLRVNSPGGSATASEIIGREVQLISQKKPVIVSMGNVAASGGYWISTGGSYIFAEPNTITGSIGVFGLLFNIQDIAKDNGITWDVVKTANLADFDSNVRPKTEQELRIYQGYVRQIYDLFIDKVAQSRNLPRQKVAQIAQGRVWSGEDAKNIGLVDQIGGLDAAITYAAEKAKLDKDWQIQEYPENVNFDSELISKFLKNNGLQSEKSSDYLTNELLKLRQELTVFQIFNDPKGVYSYFPLSGVIK